MSSDREISDYPHAICLEGINRVVQVETTEGSNYTGRLQTLDSHGNVELVDVRCYAKDSSILIEERVFIRSSRIRLIHLPVEVKYSPLMNWRDEKVQLDIRKSLKPIRKKIIPLKESSQIPKKRTDHPRKAVDKTIRRLKR